MNINYNYLNSLTFEEAKEIFINRAIMANGFSDGDAWRHAVRKISDMLESGELQELKTGHWIVKRTIMHDGEFYCDVCENGAPFNKTSRFCPNCGAKMVEPRESEGKE